MSILSRNYALKLETLFRTSNDIHISSDRFEYETYAALKEGLVRFSDFGIIEHDDINYLLESTLINEGDKLESYLTLNGTKSLDEFIDRLKSFRSEQ